MEESRVSDLDAREALAQIDEAAGAATQNTEAPQGVLVSMVAIGSTAFALIDVVPWSVTFAILALLIPVGLWYYLIRRNRPKARPIVRHSGPYIVYAMLLVFVLQFSRFWEAHLWWEIGLKGLLLFALCWFASSKMRDATIKNRVKDANGRPN